LPVDIGLLTSLEDLRVNNNKLAQLPVCLSALSRLRRIAFAGNPLVNIPADFPERAADTRQYLSSLQEDPVANNTVKLVVVGQEGVGKTSLLKAIRKTFWIIPHRYRDARTYTRPRLFVHSFVHSLIHIRSLTSLVKTQLIQMISVKMEEKQIKISTTI